MAEKWTPKVGDEMAILARGRGDPAVSTLLDYLKLIALGIVGGLLCGGLALIALQAQA